jgi:chitin deacetylase
MKKKVILLSLFSILLFVCFALFQFSRSRTFQFFGEIHAHIETPRSIVALTFDDGPTRSHTDEILGILREENVKATFYVIGDDIEKNPGELEKIIADGHEIGNHSFSHKRMVLVTPGFVKNEVEKTDTIIRQSGWEKEITFRPPYSKKLFVLPWYLSGHNRKTITCDVEPETYVEKSSDIIKYTLENTQNGSIILLHVMYSSRAESMRAVRPIIQGLREKGFEFKTVSELLLAKN